MIRWHWQWWWRSWLRKQKLQYPVLNHSPKTANLLWRLFLSPKPSLSFTPQWGLFIMAHVTSANFPEKLNFQFDWNRFRRTNSNTILSGTKGTLYLWLQVPWTYGSLPDLYYSSSPYHGPVSERYVLKPVGLSNHTATDVHERYKRAETGYMWLWKCILLTEGDKFN